MNEAPRQLRSATLPRRGLSRTEAAIYIGVSPSTFDKLVADERMPVAKRIGERKVWDIRALDLAFDSLPDAGEQETAANPFDEKVRAA